MPETAVWAMWGGQGVGGTHTAHARETVDMITETIEVRSLGCKIFNCIFKFFFVWYGMAVQEGDTLEFYVIP